MKTILQVDDDLFFRKMLDFIFEDAGMALVSVSDEDGCLKALKSIDPDIILLDEHLEHILGYDLAGKIYAFKPQLSVIIVSASEADELPEPLPKNIIGFIKKPINTETFVQEIVAIKQQKTTPYTSAKSTKNVNALKSKYVTHLSQKKQQIAALWPPSDSEKIERLISEVHKIAGSAGVYGFDQISHSARSLEESLRSASLDNVYLPQLGSSNTGVCFSSFMAEIERI